MQSAEWGMGSVECRVQNEELEVGNGSREGLQKLTKEPKGEELPTSCRRLLRGWRLARGLGAVDFLEDALGMFF